MSEHIRVSNKTYAQLGEMKTGSMKSFDSVIKYILKTHQIPTAHSMAFTSMTELYSKMQLLILEDQKVLFRNAAIIIAMPCGQPADSEKAMWKYLGKKFVEMIETLCDMKSKFKQTHITDVTNLSLGIVNSANRKIAEK